jgi:sRNA-binding regulator protein Hfq
VLQPQRSNPHKKELPEDFGLKKLLEKRVVIRFISGFEFTCKLVFNQKYTLFVKTDDGREHAIFKNAIAIVSPAPDAPTPQVLP